MPTCKNKQTVITLKREKIVAAIVPADIAWVLMSTALVMLMVPALAFFYGGLVRRKNLVSTLVQCIIIFAVVSLVWFFWGYSFVYGKSIGGIIGFSPSLFGLNGITINTISLLRASYS